MAKLKGAALKLSQELGRQGGKARAAKYGKRTLSRWAKLGGRPKTKKTRKKQ